MTFFPGKNNDIVQVKQIKQQSNLCIIYLFKASTH